MEANLYNEIPSVDLSHFVDGNDEQKQRFVEKLGKAYNEIGFVAVKNHYLSQDLSDRLYQQVKEFFSLEEGIKKKYEFDELAGQRGYVGKLKEHAKDSSVGDLKEFFHVGQQDNWREMGYPENIPVSEVPDFLPTAVEAYKLLEKTGIAMLRAIALYLGLKEDYFDEKVKGGNSILRPIHYFPIDQPELVPSEAVRAAAHGDINLITLLMGASADGLEILRKDGAWIPVTALPNHLVVNVGDMLERLTNYRLKSTIHRVVNPPVDKMKSSRYSIPFFMHPKSEMALNCLDNCIDAEHPKAFDDITAGEFLNQRLREIGLIK